MKTQVSNHVGLETHMAKLTIAEPRTVQVARQATGQKKAAALKEDKASGSHIETGHFDPFVYPLFIHCLSISFSNNNFI